MITTQDLREAIAECQGERNPNAQTCIKLAAFYTILDHLEKTPDIAESAYDSGHSTQGVMIDSESEFAQTVNRLDPAVVWPVMDELMETLQAVNPRLYKGVMRRLRNRE